ncbi:DUF7289 family protein [Haloarcula laminariae]|uniref:DUF7289 family protein n=1 Tax=Haloarcula laminariae TaxID=2961577 RepID=UPI002405727C|nr:Ig-like domain-containing protein [Halomicroarcula sp. FL173]
MGDRRARGQSAVVGFVLLFALVILLMTILQVSAVPSWNQGEEFDHSQRVQNDLELLRDDVRTAAATGRVTSESVRLGLRYPRRPFLLNPTDPSGTIETTQPGTVRVTNLTASGESGDYWTGDDRTFTSRHVVYRPDYNEYDNGPTTVLENSVLYDRFGNRTLPATEEQLINGRRITLVTVNGSLSRSATGSADIAVEPVSAPEQVTSVESEGPVRLQLPTQLDESAWRALLADELVANGGHVYDNITVTDGDPHDTVTITLEGDRSYDLRMARVRLGSGSAEASPHYITTESAAEPAPGGARRLVFEVRDRYNNPVSGVTVDAAVDGGAGTVTPVDRTTDENGHAVFRYDAAEGGAATVEATFGDEPGALETATITVDAAAGTGADGTGPAVTSVSTNRGASVVRGAELDLTASASDFQRGGTDIYAVEWWSDRAPPGGGPGSGNALDPVDGEYDAVDETASAVVDTSDWAVGTHTISVRARDGNGNWGPTETYELRVTDPADPPAAGSFDVGITSADSPVTSGDTASVTATVTNNGEGSATQTVTLDVDGQDNPVNTRTLTLASGESTTITLAWQTRNNAHSNSPYTATVNSDDDSDTAEITVNNPGGRGS